MKDATGELSMTAVAVVAIAAVAGLFTAFVWPSIKNGINRSVMCNQAASCQCDGGAAYCTCTYISGAEENGSGGTEIEVSCPNPDAQGNA